MGIQIHSSGWRNQIGYPTKSFLSLAPFFTLLAGPAVHLVLAGLAWAMLQSGDQASTLHWFLQVLLYTNLALFVGSLYPEKVSSIYGESGTDGHQLLAIPFWKQDEVDRLSAAYFLQEGLRAYERKDLPAAHQWIDEGQAHYPKSLLVHNGLGFLLFHTGQYAAARQSFVQLFEMQNNPPPEIKYIALNNIAYANLFLDDPVLLAEAEQFSADAYQNMPWMPAIAGTRGAVLIAWGQIEAGLTLLKNAIAEHSDPQSKALNACHIAIGENQLGHTQTAEEYIHAARILDPNCFLLTQTEKALGQRA